MYFDIYFFAGRAEHATGEQKLFAGINEVNKISFT